MLCYIGHEKGFTTLGQNAYDKHTHCISRSLLSLKELMVCDKKYMLFNLIFSTNGYYLPDLQTFFVASVATTLIGLTPNS